MMHPNLAARRCFACPRAASLLRTAPLAAALAASSAPPSGAGVPALEFRDDLASTFYLEGVAGRSAPALGDLDADGDLDLLSGIGNGGFAYFENVGGALSPDFDLAVANPLSGEDVGTRSKPALGDLDADGDLDVVAGKADGAFAYFANEGDATSPVFVVQAGASNPLDGESVSGEAAPALADLDRDGDLDLVSGDGLGGFTYYENSGTRTSPAYVRRAGGANPFTGVSLGVPTKPAFWDTDGDGDLDVVVGLPDGRLRVLENRGTPVYPLFALLPSEDILPLSSEAAWVASVPIVGDLDGDGDHDLVSGALDGRFHFLENLGRAFNPRPTTPVVVLSGDIGDCSAPTLGDLDGDGDLDLITGQGDDAGLLGGCGGSDGGGGFRYFENQGGPSNPRFVQALGSNPFGLVDIGSNSRPTLGDLDGDGDLDLLSGQAGGGLRYLENVGTPTSADFVLMGGSNPFGLPDLGSNSAPALGDIDGDGDLDLAAGADTGTGDFDSILVYYENTGTPFNPVFVERTGFDNPLPDEKVNGADGTTPSFGDVDGDGDVDLLIGNFEGGFTYYENFVSGSARFFVNRFSDFPMFGQDVGNFSTPAMADVDGDGEIEFVSGEESGGFFYFDDVSTPGTYAVVAGSAQGVYLRVLGEVGDFATPAMGDLDGDGDLELISGELGGGFLRYANEGTRARPFFDLTGCAVSGPGLQDIGNRSTPELVDLDGDGDLDLLSGSQSGFFSYFENTGTPQAPTFVLSPPAGNPLSGFDVGSDSAPTLGDLDGDGDLDMVSGDQPARFTYFENTGGGSSPVFAVRAGPDNPLNFELGFNAKPSLGDVDGDGDLDLLVGVQAGTSEYFENTGTPTSPAFVFRPGEANPAFGLDVGSLAAPELRDVDGDGDPDAVVGNGLGTFAYYENGAVQSTTVYTERVGSEDPLAGESVAGAAMPAFGDLDGDGDLDLLSGDASGGMAYFVNSGNAGGPAFSPAPLASVDELDLGDNAAPTLVDLDGDGDLDLAAGSADGAFHYFENTGSATSPAFSLPGFDPLSGLSLIGDATLTFGDLDTDGDLDLLAGNTPGDFAYFENTGTAQAPVFIAQTGGANPLVGQTIGQRSAPVFDDLDRDGDLDVVVGAQDGTLSFFENAGDATAPVFVGRIGGANPFDGLDLGLLAAPTLGDFDGDGRSDVVAGEFGGSFRSYGTRVPEPRLGLLLGSGLVLLLGLGRRRAAISP